MTRVELTTQLVDRCPRSVIQVQYLLIKLCRSCSSYGENRNQMQYFMAYLNSIFWTCHQRLQLAGIVCDRECVCEREGPQQKSLFIAESDTNVTSRRSVHERTTAANKCQARRSFVNSMRACGLHEWTNGQGKTRTQATCVCMYVRTVPRSQASTQGIYMKLNNISDYKHSYGTYDDRTEKQHVCDNIYTC